jgi:hypothetical protein
MSSDSLALQPIWIRGEQNNSSRGGRLRSPVARAIGFPAPSSTHRWPHRPRGARGHEVGVEGLIPLFLADLFCGSNVKNTA